MLQRGGCLIDRARFIVRFGERVKVFMRRRSILSLVMLSILSLVVLATGSFLGACSLVPTSGPASYDVESGVSPTVPYALVKLTPETLSIITGYEPRGLAGAFPAKQLP